VAEAAVAKALKTDPAPFMSAGAARLIEFGNIEDDLERAAACDWIVEVVLERLDVKQALYKRLDAVRRPGTAISSNTSTIPLHTLIEGMPERFARDFMITHFFNPPRYMRLMELVTGPLTDAALAASVDAFCDVKLDDQCTDRGAGAGASGRRGGRHYGAAVWHPQDRRFRAVRSGGSGSWAACECQHGGGTAEK
jgi:3-hydroxyacyl-CoA dehydrogenase